MSKIKMNIWKYKIVEYEVKKLTNTDIEYAKTIHKTNSKLFMYIIILCLKINHVKYEVIRVYD